MRQSRASGFVQAVGKPATPAPDQGSTYFELYEAWRCFFPIDLTTSAGYKAPAAGQSIEWALWATRSTDTSRVRLSRRGFYWAGSAKR